MYLDSKNMRKMLFGADKIVYLIFPEYSNVETMECIAIPKFYKFLRILQF